MRGHVGDGGGLDNGLVDAFHQDPVTCWHPVHLHFVPVHSKDCRPTDWLTHCYMKRISTSQCGCACACLYVWGSASACMCVSGVGGGECTSACTCMRCMWVHVPVCLWVPVLVCACMCVCMCVSVVITDMYVLVLLSASPFCLFLGWRWIYRPPANPQAQNNHLQFHTDSLCSKYTRSVIINFFHHTHLASEIQSRPTWPKRESSSSCSV